MAVRTTNRGLINSEWRKHPLQGTPTRASNPSAVGVHRVARRRLRRPAAPAAVRLGNVGAEVEGRQIDEHPIAVVPLIGDHLVDDRGLAVGDGRHRFEILSRGGDRAGDRGRIALIGTLDGDTHNGACASRIPNSLGESRIEAPLRGA